MTHRRRDSTPHESRAHAYDPAARWRGETPAVVSAWKLSVKVGGGLLAAVFASSEIWRVLALPANLSNGLFVVLLLLMGLFVTGWVWVTEHELRLLSQWLDPSDYEPPSDQAQMLESVGIAVLLVSLLVATRDPLWYGIVYVASTVLVMVGVRHLNRELRKAIDGSQQHLREVSGSLGADTATVYRSALDLIENYFLKRSHIMRYAIAVVTGSVGVVLAIAWKRLGTEDLKAAAYGVFICHFVVSETVILRWRQARDSSLRKLSTQLLRLKRQQSAVTR